MARERTLWYEKRGMSRLRVLELKLVCQRYAEYTAEIPVGADWENSLPVRKRRAIEAAARAASEELYPYLMQHVTTGVLPEKLCAPCGSRQFYQARRRFFVELHRLWDEAMRAPAADAKRQEAQG